MTEFKRTVQAVDEIEVLVQAVLDRGDATDVQRLRQLAEEVGPAAERLRRKAQETDPLKQTYGPQMREKVLALAERWISMEGLVGDVLRERAGAGTVPTAPRTVSAPAAVQLPAPAQPSAARAAAVRAPEPAAGRPAGSASELPAWRAESSSAAAFAGAGGQSTSASSTAIPTPLAAPLPVVGRMDALLHLVHCVFVSHGFTRADEGGSGVDGSQGPIRVRYTHQSRPSVTATYVPVQRHLIVYAVAEDNQQAPSKVNVQVGMAVQSVQAKVDYLLLYPLVYHQCVPALGSLPPEVCFGLMTALSLPALAAVGAASRALRATVFEDDVLWWRVLMALPPSDRLQASLNRVLEAQQREALPAGTCRRLVREEVERARVEAAERRRRREELERHLRDSRNPLLVQPPRRPQRFPGLPGFAIGGPDDLMPGGGFGMPSRGGPFGGRDPYGGGFGGGFH